jgi:hypothetical protein
MKMVLISDGYGESKKSSHTIRKGGSEALRPREPASAHSRDSISTPRELSPPLRDVLNQISTSVQDGARVLDFQILVAL